MVCCDSKCVSKVVWGVGVTVILTVFVEEPGIVTTNVFVEIMVFVPDLRRDWEEVL